MLIKKIAGINACLNNSNGFIPAVTEQIIAGRLGGKSNPNDPAVVIIPNENRLEYPSCIKIG